MTPNASVWQQAFAAAEVPNDLTILVTGGSGFIGSAFLNLAVPALPGVRFVNADKLSYAGNPMNLEAINDASNYTFEQVDLADRSAVDAMIDRHRPDWVFHFAAETHVDRSILDPGAFVVSNVVGTYNLLESCRRAWTDLSGKIFHHVSTDEVFGSLGDEGYFSETTPYDPSSPYSASKAGSDHLVRAYARTFGLPTRLTNCSNNYGPRQFPEKLIPLMTLNALNGGRLPVYGSGANVRDWLYVDDHCEAIWTVATKGKDGETYMIGGNSERTNLQVVKEICAAVAEITGKPTEQIEGQIEYVTDRLGHDHRYAIDASRLRNELGWSPRATFEMGLRDTVRWYVENPEWVKAIQTGEYHQWLDRQYGAKA